MWEDTGTKMSPTLLQQQNRDLNYAMKRNSVSITHTKGLLNGPGQNNCFLNSAVQVLWHLDIFRRSFRELTGHACMADSCIFCALKELFAQFQYSHESALPPDALRRALAETFFNQQRFQLGFMDDAAECFENILLRIHSHIANMESEDMCNAPHCISHQKFAMTLVEQSVCHACGATSEPLSFTQMVHYVSASALCAQAKQAWDEGATVFPEFGQLLRKAGGMGDMRHCPSACGAKIQICRSLMNRPEIVSVGIVWDSERPTLDHIMNVFSTIRTTIKLQDMFHSVVDSRWASSSVHQLVGVVTYYGKHYSTFFFHTKLRVWIYFDDATVREIGPRWDQVVEKCHRGHFQPLLLLYAHPHGTPISLESAPQVITYINGHKRTSGSNKADIGRDSYDMEASRTKPNLMNPVHRRAVTPNPESNYDTSKEIQPRRAITPNPDPHVHANGGKSNSLPNTLQHTSGKEGKDYDSNHLSTQDIAKECSPVGNGIYGHLNYSHENSRSTVADTKGNWRSMNEDQNQSKNHTLQAEDLHVLNRRGSNEPDNVFKFPPPKSLLEEMKLSLNPETERLIRDVDGIYISRKAVESVLNYQKLQRQRSLGGSSGYNSSTIGNRNSNSSIESFETGLRNRNQINNYPTEMKTEGVDATNLPRRRDSGNWSGDRNSASSSSSVSLDNPYMHVVANKRPFAMPTNRNPPMKPSDFSGNPMYDPGYDSYSLSSNDSFPLSPIAKHSQQLAQIPENPIKGGEIRMHSSTNSIDDCERLCIEADHFLEKSKEMEDTGDFLGAISLCNGAAAKARAAMDAPYTNPQSITFARMKHNTCVMRARSLHRRYLMRQESLNSQGSTTSTETDNSDSNKSENIMEGRHSRQSSADRSRRGEGSHSRQSSRDNTSHSRQSSRDSTHKKIANIEIYATLPKKNSKKKLDKLDKIKTGSVRAKDEHIFLQTHEKYKELVNFAEEKRVMKLCEIGKDEKIKAKRKEDRKQKGDTDFSDYASEWELTRKPNLHHTYSGPACLRDLTSSQSYTDLSKVKPDPPKPINPGKKQHKIRRKLLMGGLIRRKNRSMPDLREGQDGNEKSESTAFDDLQKGPFIEGNLTGYLSDAHLDSVQHRFPEQSLQKQVLYGSQRQLHSSHGKIPPQPPVRTTSQLSSRPQINSAAQKASFHPLLVDHNGTFPPGKQTPNYHPIKPHKSNSFHHVLPSKTHSTQQIVVQAEVHHERTPSDNIRPVSHKHSQDSNFGVSMDQKPLSPKPVMMNYEKPPSVVRNANLASENKSSNDPSANGHSSLPADSSVKSADTDEDLPKGGGLLAELQAKRKQILKPKIPLETSKITDNQKSAISPTVPSASNSSSTTSSSCGWLQELQAKQMMMLQQRKTSQDGKQQSTVSVNKPTAPTEVGPIHVKQYNVIPNLKTNLLNNNPPTTGKINLEETEVDARPKSVKDLASKFEKIVSPVLPKKNTDSANPRDNIASTHHTNSLPSPTFIQNSSLYSLPNPQHDATSKKTICVPSKFSTNNRGNEAYFKMNNGHVNNENALDHVSGNSDDLSNSLTRSSGSFSNSSENRLQHSALHNSEYRQNTFHSTSQTVSFSNSHNPIESSTVWQQKEQQAHVQQAVPPISYGKSHQDVAEISADSVDFGLRNGVVSNSKSYQLHNHYYPQTPADPNHLNRSRDCVDGINVIPNGTNSMRLTQRTSDNQMKADIPHYNTKSIDHSTAEQYKNAIRQMNIRADHRIDSAGTQNIECNGNKNMASAHSDNHKPLDTDSLVQNSAATCSKKKKTGKKSVTFSDQIALVASADDGSEDFIPNPLLERVYKTVALQQRQPKPVIQNSLHKHSTVQPPVAHPHIPPPVCCDPPIPHGLTKLNCSPNKVPCHLCRKKSVLPPTVYCPDCDFYMSRFKPK